MKTIISIFFLLLMPISFNAQDKKTEEIKPSEENLIEQLKLWDDKLLYLKADFKQEVNFTDVEIKQNVEGKLFYKKPNNLRIEHIKPNRQAIITDKKDIYVAKIKDKQLIKTSWETWKKSQPNSGLLDFGDYKKLISENDIKLIDEKNGYTLEFKNKEKSKSYTLTITLSKEDFFPIEATLSAGNTIIKTTLYNVEKNKEIEQNKFDISEFKKYEILDLYKK